MKKCFALTLALLMIIAVFVGCGKKKATIDDETSPDANVAETTTAETETRANPFGGTADPAVSVDLTSPDDDKSIPELLDPENFEGADIPDDRDYGGYKFNVLCDTSNVNKEFLAESDGELIKDAVIARQNYIEEFVAIDFALTETLGGYNNMEGYASEIESASGAGTPYDLALAYNLIPPVVAAKGLSRDLADSDNLNLVKTEKPYWGKEIKKEIMIGGRIFWMSDNSSWNNIRNMLCMYVNTEYFSRINEGYSKSDLYTMVKNGTWTMENLLLLIENSYDDTNVDKEGADDLDSFGLQAAEQQAWLDTWLYAAGFRYTQLNSEGSYDWTLGDQVVVDFIDWWQEKLNNVNIDKQDGTQYQMFLDGRAMFALSTVGMTEQNPEIEYTVLPLPLYKSSVKPSYSTPFSNTYSSWLIPRATKSEAFERSATVLELLAAEGNRRLAPVYFEIYLKKQSAAADLDMQQMFNLIRNCITFDLGYLYGSSLTVEDLNGSDTRSEVFIALRRTWAGNGTGAYANISVVWGSIKNTATTKLNDLMVDILEY